ncbi:MAG TPA: serine/threonine-protein kinase [Gemmatimonadaceae bacterium]|nr:serine/threonine-protein kinase [Gemmatimonadaceae bacterium]
MSATQLNALLDRAAHRPATEPRQRPALSLAEREALAEALADQYEIVYLIGQGGMGAVYLARCRTLDRLVAIKVLAPELARSDASRERFRREARAAARLMHPGIVPLHAFGEKDGFAYIVMGFVRGESLAARLRREGTLPPDETRQILLELAQTLEYSHRQGVVHRDVKPDNILVDRESGRLLLTDFGIAKLRTFDPAPAGEEAVGTPHYMAPEQALGERDVDGRADVSALGVLGYVLLTGRAPFEGETLQELICQHVTAAPVPLRALAPHVPPELAGVIMRCLAKEPRDRWRDAAELTRALEKAKTGPGWRWWGMVAGMMAAIV